jgi:hypothetical protein
MLSNLRLGAHINTKLVGLAIDRVIDTAIDPRRVAPTYLIRLGGGRRVSGPATKLLRARRSGYVQPLWSKNSFLPRTYLKIADRC